MKMKYLLLLLLATLGFSACEEDSERFYLYQISEVYFPDQAISGTVLEITGSSNVGIMGGVAPYTIEIADEQIVEAGVFPFRREKDEYEIRISSLQLGSTSIVVKDASGLAIRLGVKVVEGIQLFITKAVKVEIEGATVSEDDKKEIKKKVENDADMKPGGRINFVYQTKKDGTLTLKSAEGATGITGTFTQETKEVEGKSAISIHATYDNGDERIFNVTNKIGDTEITSRDLGPLYQNLEEDVTEKIQETYPAVTSVTLIYEGTKSH